MAGGEAALPTQGHRSPRLTKGEGVLDTRELLSIIPDRTQMA